MLPSHGTFPRRLGTVALAAVLAAVLAGCQTTQSTDATGALAMATPRSDADWRRVADAWGERNRANPSDPTAAINYAQALRANGQRAQAVAVLEQASIHNPGNMDLLGAYGRALADEGQFERALDVLNRAHSPELCGTVPISVLISILFPPPPPPPAAFSRCRARSSTRWAATRKRSAITRPRCGSCLTSHRCSPISGFPTRSRAIWCAPSRPCGARLHRQCRREGPPEPGAGDRPAGPFRGGRNDGPR